MNEWSQRCMLSILDLCKNTYAYVYARSKRYVICIHRLQSQHAYELRYIIFKCTGNSPIQVAMNISKNVTT